MRLLDLDKLLEGYPGVVPVVGAFLSQAAAVCLESFNHKSGVVLEVGGAFEETIQVVWSQQVDDAVKKSWGDSLEATEYGAAAIAILLMTSFTNLTVVERTHIGTRMDYYLGILEESEQVGFVRKARLEVSGIGRETVGNTIEKRTKEKLTNVRKADDPDLPAYVIIVEFSTPKIKITIDENRKSAA